MFQEKVAKDMQANIAKAKEYATKLTATEQRAEELQKRCDEYRRGCMKYKDEREKVRAELEKLKQ